VEAHGEDFREESNDVDKTEHLKHNWREANLPAPDQTLCAWAEKVTLKLQEVGQADGDPLHDAGLSENAISDAAQVIGFQLHQPNRRMPRRGSRAGNATAGITPRLYCAFAL